MVTNEPPRIQCGQCISYSNDAMIIDDHENGRSRQMTDEKGALMDEGKCRVAGYSLGKHTYTLLCQPRHANVPPPPPPNPKRRNDTQNQQGTTSAHRVVGFSLGMHPHTLVCQPRHANAPRQIASPHPRMPATSR
jgi:hypothetical protein